MYFKIELTTKDTGPLKITLVRMCYPCSVLLWTQTRLFPVRCGRV